MFKFLLVILMVAEQGVVPVRLEPFNERAACEKARLETLKQIPRDPTMNFIAVCAPVRNATQVDV